MGSGRCLLRRPGCKWRSISDAVLAVVRFTHRRQPLCCLCVRYHDTPLRPRQLFLSPTVFFSHPCGSCDHTIPVIPCAVQRYIFLLPVLKAGELTDPVLPPMSLILELLLLAVCVVLAATAAACRRWEKLLRKTSGRSSTKRWRKSSENNRYAT